MKKLYLLSLVLCSLILSGCGNPNVSRTSKSAADSKKDAQKSVWDLKRTEVISRLESKHNAVASWDSALSNQVYTAEIQDALVRVDHKPVVVDGTLKDVIKKKGKYLLVMEYVNVNKYYTDGDLEFELECSDEYAKQFMSDSHDTNYVIVASIAIVEKSETGVHADVTVGGTTDADATLTAKLTATGTCLECVSLGERPH